jgi:LPS-assembly protein
LSYKFNLTSLSRDQASYDPISQNAQTLGWCQTNTADTAVLIPQNCLLRGIPGEYDRASMEADWRRTVITNNGMEFTPFLRARGDFASVNVADQPGVANYMPVGESELARVMPTAGLEFRYPFIDVEPWGTQTIEPIAQLILRPNEADIGRFPNEDAQSLVFDDSNLFQIDKFSGWDRAEGGGRVNAGLQYTAQLNQAGSVNFLFGQSYQLFGMNSYAVADLTNTGVDSGLEHAASDYVTSINYSPNSIFTFSTRARLDEATLNVQRFEAEGRATFNRWSASILYGDYAAQPDLGYLTRRRGILGTGSIKIASNWVVQGAARWDLETNQVNQYSVGAGYVDDCFVIGLNYVTSYTYAAGTTPPQLSHAVMLQIGLRTLGQTSGTGGSTGVQ